MLPAWEDWTHPFPVLHLGCQLTINSTTTLCQWNDSYPPLNPEIGLKNPGRTLYTDLWAWFLHSPHSKLKEELTIQCETWQPNITSTHLVLSNLPGLGVFQFCSSKINELSSRLIRRGEVGQRSPQTSERWAELTHCLQFTMVANNLCHFWTNSPHNQAHCTHQDSNTHYNCILFWLIYML